MAPGSADEINQYIHKYIHKYNHKYNHKYKHKYKNEGDIPENRLVWKSADDVHERGASCNPDTEEEGAQCVDSWSWSRQSTNSKKYKYKIRKELH